MRMLVETDTKLTTAKNGCCCQNIGHFVPNLSTDTSDTLTTAVFKFSIFFSKKNKKKKKVIVVWKVAVVKVSRCQLTCFVPKTTLKLTTTRIFAVVTAVVKCTFKEVKS